MPATASKLGDKDAVMGKSQEKQKGTGTPAFEEGIMDQRPEVCFEFFFLRGVCSGCLYVGDGMLELGWRGKVGLGGVVLRRGLWDVSL